MNEHDNPSSGMAGDRMQAAPPQWSADGRWWWTGSEWIPGPPRPGASTGHGTVPAVPVRWSPDPWMVGVAVFLVLLVVLAVFMGAEMTKQNGREDDYSRLTCQQFGENCDQVP